MVFAGCSTPAYPGGAKGARAPRGSKAKNIQISPLLAIFLSNFIIQHPVAPPLAWNPAYASAVPVQTTYINSSKMALNEMKGTIRGKNSNYIFVYARASLRFAFANRLTQKWQGIAKGEICWQIATLLICTIKLRQTYSIFWEENYKEGIEIKL